MGTASEYSTVNAAQGIGLLKRLAFGAMGCKVYDFYGLQPNNHSTVEEMGCGSNYCVCLQPFSLQNQKNLSKKGCKMFVFLCPQPISPLF